MEHTGRGVIFDAQIDVLINTEAEVAFMRRWHLITRTPKRKRNEEMLPLTSGTEVPLLQLVLLNLKTTLDDLLSSFTAHSHMARNLLITTDSKLAHGVTRYRVHGVLVRKGLQHLGRTGQTITTLTNTTVDDDLLDEDVTHLVCALLVFFSLERVR